MANIDQARVRIDAADISRERAERIARLVFYHLHMTLAGSYLDAGPRRAVPHLVVPALQVDPDEMDDDAIARRGAAWVYRWLTNAD